MFVTDLIRFTSFLLAFLLIALASLDLILRGLPTNYFIVLASEALTMLLSTILILTFRRISMQNAIAAIPRVSIPIGRKDLPFSDYKAIQNGLSRTAEIKRQFIPREYGEFGWGKPGTALQGVHFRASALKTWDLIEASVGTPKPWNVDRRSYLEQHVLEKSILDSYLEFYTAFEEDDEVVTEEVYREFMKAKSIMLKLISKYKNLPKF